MRTDFVIPTQKQTHILYFSIQASAPCWVGVVGQERQDPSTRYLDFDVQLRQGINLIEVPMPVSPEELAVSLSLKTPNAQAQLMENSVGFANKPRTLSLRLDKNVAEYVSVALEFSKRASHEPLDVFYTHQDKEGNSLAIWKYMEHIRLNNNQIAHTPAATFVDSGNMWVSKAYMLRMTVPVRFFTLLHEHAHYVLGLPSDPNDPTIEQRCDIWARNIFYAMGFTERDLHRLVGQALTNTATNQARMDIINNYQRNVWQR